jgi:uncharacterized membrane protein
MQNVLRVFGWTLMTLSGCLVVVMASRYFTLQPEVFFSEQREVYQANLVMLVLHIGGAVLALLVGPWQFWSWLRFRHLNWHRWMGRAYYSGVLAGSSGGLWMACVAYGGLPSRLGFGLLAVLWLSTGVAGYRAIRRGAVEVHREWMIRNFSLTFAAVTLRIYQPILSIAEFSFEEAYISVAWISWVPNLILSELYLQRCRRAVLTAAK